MGPSTMAPKKKKQHEERIRGQTGLLGQAFQAPPQPKAAGRPKNKPDREELPADIPRPRIRRPGAIRDMRQRIRLLEEEVRSSKGGAALQNDEEEEEIKRVLGESNETPKIPAKAPKTLLYSAPSPEEVHDFCKATGEAG